jgi:hypothetical protein
MFTTNSASTLRAQVIRLRGFPKMEISKIGTLQKNDGTKGFECLKLGL